MWDLIRTPSAADVYSLPVHRDDASSYFYLLGSSWTLSMCQYKQWKYRDAFLLCRSASYIEDMSYMSKIPQRSLTYLYSYSGLPYQVFIWCMLLRIDTYLLWKTMLYQSYMVPILTMILGLTSFLQTFLNALSDAVKHNTVISLSKTRRLSSSIFWQRCHFAAVTELRCGFHVQ